ncbi:MAG TPA: hypothetical protein VKB18_07380 [Gemmatimonadota bacterium]|nr:hypothetical protein [Gemmatimonadota bacterium]
MSGRAAAPGSTLALLACAAVLAWPASVLRAQGYRGQAGAFATYLELRPLVRDSLPEDQVPGDGLRRRLADLTVVSCTPNEYCRWYRSGPVRDVAVATQEVRAVGWSGIAGLSAHVHLRGRFGTDDLWPRADQTFEALTAYLDYDHGDYRFRAGRQYRVNGLGYYNFDGLAATWRGFDPLTLEAWAGWSLGRGLNAPRSGDLLAAADEFAPDDRGLVLGLEAGAHWGRRLAGTVVYQREIRTDLDALYAERMAMDATGIAGPVRLDASVTYDLSFREVNDARLRARVPLPAGVRLTLEGRHRTPFFELWTIWGAFSPVGFNEGSAAVDWPVPGTDLLLGLGGGYRSYERTGAGTSFTTIRDDGWRVSATADWTHAGWYAGGSYRAEVGFGASSLGGGAELGRRFGDRARLGVRATSTQMLGEFRFGEQRLTGAALEGRLKMWNLDLTGSAGLYHLGFDESPGTPDWTQLRGFLGVSRPFGSGPRAHAGGGR